jgi:hypothetical protein
MNILPSSVTVVRFWREWAALIARINRYYTVWLSYLLVALGGAMTYWDSIDDYLPKKARGAAYAVIGVAVLILRARRDFATLKANLATPPV